MHETNPKRPLSFWVFPFRYIPIELLQPIFSHAMKLMHSKHLSVFERLTDLPDTLFFIDPIDMPFAFLLDVDFHTPSLRVVTEKGGSQPLATIRGQLNDLLALLEGREDGDALFFSRRLVIEGSTEAVVALRNAVDGEEISLIADQLNDWGKTGSKLQKGLSLLKVPLNCLRRDIQDVKDAFWAPIHQDIQKMHASVENMQGEIEKLRKEESKKSRRLQKPTMT